MRMPPERWPRPLPTACHTLPMEPELDFIQTLMQRGMGRLVPASSVAVDPATGQPVVAGFFCVEHKATKDRLIQDRKPANETEYHLGWLDPPSGAQMASIFLRPTETLRVSADDYETYFYRGAGPEGSLAYSAVGRPWRLALQQRGAPRRRHRRII